MNTLKQIINLIIDTAGKYPNVNFTHVNDVYDLNNFADLKYSAFVLTQQQHRQDDEYYYYHFYAFYVDRLTDDEKNRVDVQSTALQMLKSLIATLQDEYGLMFEGEVLYNTFNERFTQVCAGAYADFTLMVDIDACADNYVVPKPKDCEDEIERLEGVIKVKDKQIREKDEEIAYKNRLQSISITENGQYRPTMGNYAFDVVDVNVSLPIYDCAIYYTTTDGQTVQYDENKYDNIISNTYVNGIGCIAFDGEIDTMKGWFFKNKTLQTIIIPSSIKTIENDAFADCDLVELYIPANVQTINGSAGINYNPRIQSLSIAADNPYYSSDGNALMHGTQLQLATNNTVIPQYCTEILANAFEKKQLSTIDIPANVKSIGMFAFKDCTNLSSIYAYPTNPPGVVSGFFSPFNGCPENGVLHIPAGSDYTSWLAALPDGWTIEEMGSGEESERVKELEQKISSLNVEIASLNAEVNTQQETITRQAETIAGQEQTIAVRDNTISELNALLVQKDETIDAQTKVIEARDKTIADQTAEIASKDTEIASKDSQIQRMSNLAELDITENGEYSSPEGYYAISTVNVHVGEGPTPPEPPTPTEDFKIYYTTTDGKIINPSTKHGEWNVNILSNTYEDGQGCITFDGAVTDIPEEGLSLGLGIDGTLSSVALPQSLVNIGDYAFMRQVNLKNITCLAQIAPTLDNVHSPFYRINNFGTLHVPAGSDYSSWLEVMPVGWTVEYI